MKRNRHAPPLPAGLVGSWEWYERQPKAVRHKGVDYYDRERWRRKDNPHTGNVLKAPTGAVAEWIVQHAPELAIDPDGDEFWTEGRLYSIAPKGGAQAADGAERETPEYTLRNVGGDYPWRVDFGGASFNFATLAIAEAAIPELLKRRSARHPQPAVSRHGAADIFFTQNRLKGLAKDKKRDAPQAAAA